MKNIKKYLSLSILVTFMALFSGCELSKSGTESVVSLNMSKQDLVSGETEIATIVLKDSADTTKTYIVDLSSNKPSEITIAPDQCVLSKESPRCEVKITSNINDTTYFQLEEGISITASYNDDVRVIGKITHVPASTQSRFFQINNQCSFDVWMGTSGASAAQIGCTPSSGDKNYQANCPTDQICLTVSANANYCVNAKIIDVNATTPINIADEKTKYTLNSAGCPGGIITDKSSTIYGQCVCSFNDNCAKGQKCLPSAGKNQCMWDLDIANAGHVATGTTLKVPLSYDTDSLFAASGAMYIKLGCESGKCISDNKDPSLQSPTTFIEYTLANKGLDYYDISNINGANIPVSMKPIITTKTPFENNSSTTSSFAKNAYWCSVAGGTTSEFKAHNTELKNAGYSPLSTLESNYGCKNSYNTTYTPGLTFVKAKPLSTKQTCTEDKNCTGSSAGSHCGVAADDMINIKQTKNYDRAQNYSCGEIIGYNSLTQLCGIATATAGYHDTTEGIKCSNETVSSQDFTNYALCSMKFDGNDTGPARSCFNANQTASGDTCCGYSTWSGMISDGSQAVSGVTTSGWTNKVQSFIKPMKEGCYTAYSYQYDDPYSTFTCQSKEAVTNKNTLSYQITLCDQKAEGGITVPTLASCRLNSNYPSSTNPNSIAVPPPNIFINKNSTAYTMSVYSVAAITDAVSSFTKLSKISATADLNSTQNQVFPNVYQDSNNYYYVLGQNPKDSTYQGCMIKSVAGTCIKVVDSKYNSIGCSVWGIAGLKAGANDYPFGNRQVNMPAFTNGSKANPLN
ncbi:MAG: hypothetical protein GQ570_14480 [Helicobacteraceae bacterium]|nr:hypothetical protein [Helicobacteraceae bacterium]